MNKIEIEIPDNKEIDWVESAKQEKIVFKNKQLTYENVCKELFKEDYFYMSNYGTIIHNGTIDSHIYESNNAITKHQLECILAKNKLANVARFLNGEWDKYTSSDKFIIWINPNDDDNLYISDSDLYTQRATIIFKSEQLARQAIEILGEETVKLALESLY